MTEEQLFLAALELPKATDRAAYLETACGGNTELRRHVEELLAAHFKSGEFLDVPVPRQAGLEATPPSAATNVADQGTVSNEASVDLHFLEPTTRTDSLGRIGHHEALQILGQGGFGIVFRAFDEVLQRVVALKVLAPHIAATSPARKRFLREARASARVRHENVVQIHAVEEQPLPHLVMEYIAGETLQQRLDRIGPLGAEEIVALGLQIAEGLAAAHATGLIHRDVKPGNILIEEGSRERAKLTDFGLARAADDASMTQSGILAGTPMYMSPEQAQGETLDQRADLFSLGSVLYVMASGRPPFRAATTFAVLKRVVEEPARPIADLIPECPQWLCEIIAKLHAKKPGERYQSAREVADLLARCESQLKTPGGLPDVGISRRTPAAGRFDKLLWLAAVALLLPIFTIAVTEIAGLTQFFAKRPPQTKLERAQVNVEPPMIAAPEVKANEPAPENVPSPKAESPDRRAAEYALGLGGKVKFQTTGGSQLITSAAELPADEFQLTGVYLSHISGVKDEVTDDLLALLTHCVHLEALDVAFAAQVTDQGVFHLKPCQKLKYLNLAGTQLTDTGLACCKEFNDLHFLVLDRTQVTDAGLKDTFAGRRNITWLQLAGLPQVSDAGLAVFRDCVSMQKVFLEGTPITDDGTAALSDMTKLIELRLNQCRVTADGVAKLAKQFPQCVIRWDGEAVVPRVAEAAFTDADLRRIAALPAAEQVKEVGKALQRLNPGFNGELIPGIHNDIVTNLVVSTEHVSNLAPLRALTGLQTLECSAGDGIFSPFTDLSPLSDLPLTHLKVRGSRVKDLTPLKRLPLVALNCSFTSVTDVTPLAGLPLTNLDLSATEISDISPLQGLKLNVAYFEGALVKDLTPLKDMPLVTLSIGKNVTDLAPLKGIQLQSLTCTLARGVTDLSPLTGMPLKVLNLYATQVSDLAPLEGMPLEYLNLQDTKVTDLAPLRKLQSLRRLNCPSDTTDLSPLQGLALENLHFRNLRAERDAPILREIPTLKTINDKPAEEFWKEVAGEK